MALKGACLLLTLALFPPVSEAQSTTSTPQADTTSHNADDGIYGRFDGDLSLYGGAGAVLRLEGDDQKGAASLELDALFLDAAGPFFAIDIAPEAPDQIALGIQLRPLFPARFFLNRFFENAFLNRTIESLHLEIGTGFRSLAGDAEIGVLVGTGIDIPLTAPMKYWGLVLRLGARYLRIRDDQQNGGLETRNQWTLRATFLFVGRPNILL